MNTRPAELKGLFSKARWAELSDQQQEVIRWVLEETGSLELMARAGCGKTYTLMKVVEAIAEFQLGDVALMAFNKSIADELKAKLESMGIDWRVANAGTSHSFGFGAWRKIAPGVKVDDKKIFNIIKYLQTNAYVGAGSAYESDNMNSVINGLGEFELLDKCAGSINKMVSLAKQRGFGHLCAMDDPTLWLEIVDHYDLERDMPEMFSTSAIITAAIKVYKISLNQCKEIIDFDDMILAPLYYKARFYTKDWILVDESQDTNPARRALALAMLKPRTGRMIFVGDDKQAINGFAGADNDSMMQLKRITNAKTLPLNVTRRCPKAVVKLAQQFVPDFVAHKDAIEGTVSTMQYEILDKQNLSSNDAILCRNTAPLIEMAYSLLGKGIACRVEGREIGEGLIKLARRWKIKTLDKLLEKLEEYQDRETAKFMSKDQEDRIAKLVDQLDCLRVVISRCQSLKKYDVEDLVNEIQGMFGDTKVGEKAKVLTLSTVHKSKGREWKRVFMLGRSKFMPSPYAKKPWQQEQEANLEYVGITRAIEEFIDVPMPLSKKEKQNG